MTHEDYERAANHWKIKDASDEKMDRDTLLKEIEQYIKSNNTCALATGSGEFVRVTPIEYTYHDGHSGCSRKVERNSKHLKRIRMCALQSMISMKVSEN